LNNLKKHYKNLVQSGGKGVSKFELPETQFERTVRDKIDYKTHLEYENDCFKHTFEILIKFPIKLPEKILQNLVQSGGNRVSKFELPETQFERTVRDKIDCKTHSEYKNDSFKHICGILIKFSIE